MYGQRHGLRGSVWKVIEIEIETISAKIANISIADRKEDYDLDFWADEIPIKTICEFPIPDEKLKERLDIPYHILDLNESRKNGN